MEVKDAFKIIATFVYVETQKRLYDIEKLDELSIALITVRDYIDGKGESEDKK